MRTTLDLDDDVMSAARALARAEGSSMGTVISRLVRRGLRPAPPSPDEDFPTFAVPADAPVFGPAEVAGALDDEP
jgi:hypothetical protein